MQEFESDSPALALFGETDLLGPVHYENKDLYTLSGYCTISERQNCYKTQIHSALA